jgi:hypothetical protein
MRLRGWVVLLGLFGAWHCANGLPFPRVDFGGRIGVGTSGHLDNLQALAAMADYHCPLTVARIDQARQSHVQIVDGGIVHGVNVHAGKFSVAEAPEAVKVNLRCWPNLNAHEIAGTQNAARFRHGRKVLILEAGFQHTNRTVNKLRDIEWPLAFRAVRSRQRGTAPLHILPVRDNLQVVAPVVQAVMVKVIRLKPLWAVCNQSVQPNLADAPAVLKAATHIMSPRSFGPNSPPCPRVFAHFRQSLSVNDGAKPFLLGLRIATTAKRPEFNRKMITSIVPLVPHREQYVPHSQRWLLAVSTMQYHRALPAGNLALPANGGLPLT